MYSLNETAAFKDAKVGAVRLNSCGARSALFPRQTYLPRQPVEAVELVVPAALLDDLALLLVALQPVVQWDRLAGDQERKAGQSIWHVRWATCSLVAVAHKPASNLIAYPHAGVPECFAGPFAGM